MTPLKYKRISSVQFEKSMRRSVGVENWMMEWDYRLCWGPELLPGQSTTNCCCILISFSHRNSGPHPRISLFGKSLKCSLIQILYLHLEYFQSKSCHIVIEIEWSWDFQFDNSSKSAHIGSSIKLYSNQTCNLGIPNFFCARKTFKVEVHKSQPKPQPGPLQPHLVHWILLPHHRIQAQVQGVQGKLIKNWKWLVHHTCFFSLCFIT